MEQIITFPATTKHIGELLCNEVAEGRKKKGASLLHIFSVVRFTDGKFRAFGKDLIEKMEAGEIADLS